jgi:hypothetical protein
MSTTSTPIYTYEAGDKVFVHREKRLATVLDVYGDGVCGHHGDMRLDLCGNTQVNEFEPYDAAKHAAFDDTFTPIKKAWKAFYSITKDVELRPESEALGHVYEAGDKVFVIADKHLATVLNVYGDGVVGDHGEMRLDWCGNTSITDFEPYDPAKHAQYDNTFIPIRKEWKDEYGITKDVELYQE